MRFGLLGDIHANLVALDAVLADMGPVDQYWCLGDVVGYGPQPSECIERLCELDHVVVMGNHDAAAIGRISARSFNGDARRAIEWTSRQLDRSDSSYIRGMPDKLQHDQVLLVHASPSDPLWEYITSTSQAAEAFESTDAPYTFVGHTHIPLVFLLDAQGTILPGTPSDKMLLRLGNERLLINPGSVGQPRDGDPRAAYAIIDTGTATVEFHRVEYDILEAQTRMQNVGASEWLTERLAYGR